MTSSDEQHLVSDPVSQQDIERLYRALLEREPDPPALWSYLNSRATKRDVLKAITASGEFAERVERAKARQAQRDGGRPAGEQAAPPI